MKRPDLVLAGAVVLCLPMAPGVLDGSIPATTALERFLLALVVAWAVGAVLSAVVGNYLRQAQRAELLAEIERVRAERAGDATPAGHHDGAHLDTARLDTVHPDRIIPPT